MKRRQRKLAPSDIEPRLLIEPLQLPHLQFFVPDESAFADFLRRVKRCQYLHFFFLLIVLDLNLHAQFNRPNGLHIFLTKLHISANMCI